MHNDPTPHTILGTLVDRAVCMPYAKPQVLRNGRRRRKDPSTGKWESTHTIRDDVAAAASLLIEALNAPDAHEPWSRAELLLDPAGPWWPKPRDDFFALDVDSRTWVLDRLGATSDRAAACIEEEAIDRHWSWLWSQPSFAAPGKLRPAITRPDLVGGMDWKRCDLIDLKTSSKDDLRSVVKPNHKRSFASWARSLEAMRFRPEYCWVLSVSTLHDHAKWIEIMPEVERV